MPPTAAVPNLDPAASHPGPGRRDAARLKSLENKIGELAAHIDAATYQLLEAIREFDLLGGWEGFASCAHWLSFRIGMDRITAREKVRVAHAVHELPLIAEALRKGELSYSKVRAMTRIATPENEKDVLFVALQCTANQLEKFVWAYRRGDRSGEVEEARRQRERSYLELYLDEDGMTVIRGRLPPEIAALVKTALDAAVDALRKRARNGKNDVKAAGSAKGEQAPASAEAAENGREVPAGNVAGVPGAAPPPASAEAPRSAADGAVPAPAAADDSVLEPYGSFNCGQMRADALGLLAEAALGNGLSGGSRGEPWQVVVHVDVPVLTNSEEEGQCELEDGLHVSAETCRRIACDASVVTMTHGPNGEILDVGRKSRKIPRPLWRALTARDRMCRFPGCSRTGQLVAHHIQHWANQGETSLTNCILLCRGHHWAVHEGGFRMEGRAPGGLAFFYPDGKPMPGIPAPFKAPSNPLEAFRDRHRAWPGYRRQHQRAVLGWGGHGLRAGDLDSVHQPIH
ncbi:MAG: DUF222 domain-containing protein [Acidobacteriota bacterium]